MYMVKINGYMKSIGTVHVIYKVEPPLTSMPLKNSNNIENNYGKIFSLK